MNVTLPLGERRVLAEDVAHSVGLVADDCRDNLAIDAGILDQVSASSNDDGSRK